MAEQNIKMTRSREPITNPALINAINEMKKERTPQTEGAFIGAVKAARFLIPANIQEEQVAQANAEGNIELTKQPKVNFLLFNNQEGKKYFPLFTDMEEYQKWPDCKKYQLAGLSYRDFCNMLHTTNNPEVMGAVINPFSQNVMVPMETLFRIEKSDPITPGTKIQIGTLKEEPTPLLDGMIPYLETQESINAVYLRVMKREDKEQPNFLFVVDMDKTLDEAAVKQVFDGLAEAAKPNMRGVELAIVPAHNQFGMAALKEAKPFYVKGIGRMKDTGAGTQE